MKIKFLTINILHGGEFFDPLLDFVKRENPDILFMQEVNNGQNPKWGKAFRSTQELRRELDYDFFSFAPNVMLKREIGNVEQGNAIFSKYPIASQKVTFFDVPYGEMEFEEVKDFRMHPSSLQNVQVLLNNKTLNLFNIHGIWDFHGEDTERRLNMSKKIVSEIKGKENTILAGDFNVRPETKTIENIEKYLKNVFKNELKTTFNMKRKNKGGYATSVVDMIFVSKNINVVDHYCPNVDVSDHLPLVAVLEI